MNISPPNSCGLKLSKRLAAAFDAVREGCCFVDVGCDHGKLAALLVLSGRCKRGYATDISEASLSKAEALFRELGIDSLVETVCTDGLVSIDGGPVDDVIVAGLGADTIARIIAGAPWLSEQSRRLVLVPSSRHDRLRRFLYSRGFRILSERAVADSGHVYTVIIAEYRGFRTEISPVFAVFGKILDSDGDKDEYIDLVARRNRMLLAEMSQARAGDISKIREARGILRFIERIGEC